MKDRNNINALKQLFVEHSKPNADSIKGKIEFNINSDRRTVFADILVRTRVRNSLIVLITLVLVTAIALSVVFTVDFSPNDIIDNPVIENPMRFFDESKAEWDNNFDVEEYNLVNGTKIMKFLNYNEILSAKASNIDGYFRFIYEGINDEIYIKITTHVFFNNRMSKNLEYYTLFEDSILWNNIQIKYKSTINNDGKGIYNVFFHDKVNNYNYTLDITCFGNTDFNSQTLESILADLCVA